MALALSASSHRSGRPISASSSDRRLRDSPTRRYTSASPSRRRSSRRSSVRSRMQGGGAQVAPWHILNFLPDPHGHGALRGVLDHSSLTTVSCLAGRLPWRAPPVCCSMVVAPDERNTSAGASPPAAARWKPEPDTSSDDDVRRFWTAGAAWRATAGAGAGVGAGAAAGAADDVADSAVVSIPLGSEPGSAGPDSWVTA